MSVHLDDVLQRSMTLLASLIAFLVFPFFFLVSDGLTAGLRWEKDNCFASFCALYFPISAFCCLLAGIGVKLMGVLGWNNFGSSGW